MRKRVAVIGANGMLGYAVCSYFQQTARSVRSITRRDFDIAVQSFSALDNLISDCDEVINCAGIIKPVIEHVPIESVLKVNTVFPRNLARYCLERKKLCFHITTDCVFDGLKGCYSELDFLDANDVYGLSKAGGEPNNCMVLRTSIVGEEHTEHRSLLEWARSQSGKRVSGFTNHYWNGLTTHHLARIIEKIVHQGLYQHGTFHIFSPQTLSKFELLHLFNKIYGLELDIIPVKTDTKCDRSLSSIHTLSSTLIVESIQEQIINMRRFFLSLG